MKRLSCALGVLLAVVMVVPVWAQPVVEEAPPPPTDMPTVYHPHAGPSVLAALANVVYFPIRFAITLVTAEAGGITGFATGGDKEAANAVWQSTDGQAFLRPEVLEGRERLRFGGYD